MKISSIVFILFFFIQFESHSQYLNGYKYIYVPNLKYNDGSVNKYSVNSKLISIFQTKGFIAYNDDNALNYKDEVQNNRCQFLSSNVKLDWKVEGAYGGTRLYMTLSLINCNNKVVVTKTVNYKGLDRTADVRKCISKIYNFFYSIPYNFIPSLTPKLNLPEVENTGESEESLISYYKNNIIDDIEGIYKYVKDSDIDNTHYKIGIKKYGYKYKAIIIESGSNPIWKNGEVKFILEPSAVNTIFSCKYYMASKSEIETFCTVKNQVFLEIDVNTKDINGKNLKANFLKLYPSNIISSNNPISQGNSESKSWKGNGSGIIISKDGYFVTNNHVVENMNDFEVEFKYAQEIRSFHAKLVKTDPTNDLAILKIDDPNFKNLNSIPYNFYTRSAPSGTEVFALGYPMALSVMGKDIKFTDGKISSKTGYMGNITTYQTTTPIQPGNSGGPLFDHKANLLGINSSGLRKDVADNVSYTIKTNYLVNLIDVLPKTIPLPSSTWISSKPLTEQIKILSNYVVLIKVR